MSTATAKSKTSVIAEIEACLHKYTTFRNPYILPLAIWVVGGHCHVLSDAFPCLAMAAVGIYLKPSLGPLVLSSKGLSVSEYAAAVRQYEDIRQRLNAELEVRRDEIVTAFRNYNDLEFLEGSKEDLWKPLFTLSDVLCPERRAELECDAARIDGYKNSSARYKAVIAASAALKEKDEFDKQNAKRLAEVFRRAKNRAAPFGTVRLGDITACPCI